MGFPIRKSTDQRVFAPPRSLSQRITSFIACACQGIHQLPLRHLIVLIANAHPEQAPNGIGTKRPASRDLSGGAVRQTNQLRGIERPLRQTTAVSACSRLPSLATLPGDHARAMESEQIFSLRCQTEQAEGQEPAANLILANEPDNPATGMVEPDGIEPTTPCLQSRCSPS